ncbi:TraR/DksA family transcriptional regulator [Janibacter cremeus]|uniref:RNA polymerase-binding transcription factor DksA n=1 Tax=Janibacter cremeus TaxID=1285192 RepID=A0A852VIT6_9MICO|nr:TraR/DksA C4-type zinc finger protein [Janibacter cremeus]NYF97017.1 RNA polymerase-binding transcription factor DksA [Janibacter cremeus]
MAAKKSTARTAATKKTTPAKGAAGTTANGTTKADKKAATKSTSTAAKKPAKKTAATRKSTAKKATATRVTRAERLVVREDESPWTPAELKEVRVELEGEIARLRADLQSSENELSVFLREPIDGAGDDQADAGAKSFEREHELSLLAGARTGLEQNLHALERLEDGTYGICESCGNPIGKLRLQAYPRATLCMTCKSTQERR